MKIVLQPCSNNLAQKHFSETISNSNITIESIKKYLSDRHIINMLNEYYPAGKLMVWGVKPGSKAEWEKVEEGDVGLFTSQGSIFASVVIGLKLQSRNLAQHLWELDTDGNSWEYIYFLSDLHNLII